MGEGRQSLGRDSTDIRCLCRVFEAPGRTWRSTEWRPGGAAWQFGRQRRAALGELTVSRYGRAAGILTVRPAMPLAREGEALKRTLCHEEGTAEGYCGTLWRVR